MKLSLSILGTLLLTSNFTFANVPTQSYIKKNIMNNFIVYDMEPNQAKIYNTKPIYLLNGEQAYISNITFGLTGRNFSEAYVLTRPKLNQSAIVFDPSQGHDFKVYNTKNGNTNVSIISFNISESGQGSIYERKKYVYFNSWMSKTIATAESEDHSGSCYDTDNIKEDIVLNLQAKTYTKTTYKSKSCPEKYSLVGKKTNSIVFTKNDKEANQPFSVKIVEADYDRSIIRNGVRIIPSMTYKEGDTVVVYLLITEEDKKVNPAEVTLSCKSKEFSIKSLSGDRSHTENLNIFEKYYLNGSMDYRYSPVIYAYNKYCK